jgi:hypothetical protein
MARRTEAPIAIGWVNMASSPKTRSRAKPQPSTSLVQLFRPYAIPPSSLHEALQDAAKQAGWLPPWGRKEQQSLKRAAGKRSGSRRAGRAQMRRSLINAARARLTPEQRRSPYSKASIDALEETYRNLLTEDPSDPDILISIMLSALSETDKKFLRRASRETLKKDLKAIRKARGIESPSKALKAPGI